MLVLILVLAVIYSIFRQKKILARGWVVFEDYSKHRQLPCNSLRAKQRLMASGNE